MIGTHKTAGAHGFAAFDEARATMATDVQKHMRFARLVPSDQERAAKSIMRDCHIGRGQQCRRRDHLRKRIEQRRLFLRKPCRIGVAACQHMSNAARRAPGAIGDLPGEGHLASGGCEHVHTGAILTRFCR